MTELSGTKELPAGQMSKLEKEYLTCAREIFVHMKSLQVLENATLTPVFNLKFTKDGWFDEYELKKRFPVHYDDYTVLLTKTGVKTCIEDHVRLGVLKIPPMTNASGGPIENPTYDQYASYIFFIEIMSPIYLLLEQLKYEFTDDEIIESYKRYRKRWALSGNVIYTAF
jgi:hypothetical protein